VVVSPLVDMQPGHFRLRLGGPGRREGSLEIPEDVGEVFDAGVLTVSGAAPSQ
jgi:hypothetical protein